MALCMALREHEFDARQAKVSGAGAILESAGDTPCGIAVLDLHLGQEIDGHWIDATEMTRALCAYGWKVLVVSGAFDEEAEAAAIAAGAVGSVAKSSPFDVLIDAVRASAAGQPILTGTQRAGWLDVHQGFQAQRRDLERRFRRLSPHEVQVLDLLSEGRPAMKIAERFEVSLTTIRGQIRAILLKLECNSQIEAVALARRHASGRDRS